jgi:transcriptional regulator with XRE-family HTH domain
MHLADYMEAKGLTDDDVAKAIAVDRSTVSRLRRKETLPSWGTATKLRKFTRGAVTLNDFVEAA